MTHEQREKLRQILGRIEGLTLGVENSGIAAGFCSVAEDLAKLLEEDGKKLGGCGRIDGCGGGGF